MTVRKILAAFFLLLCFAMAKAQSVEELRAQLQAARSDTAKARISGALAYKLVFTDSTEALRLIASEIELAAGNPLYLADAYRAHALLCIIQNKRAEGLARYDTAIAFARQAKSAYYEAHCIALIGGFYQDMGDYDRSLQYYLDALKVTERGFEQSGRKDAVLQRLIASTNNNIATVYAAAGRQRELILRYYQRAMQHAVQMENYAFAGLVAANMASEYLDGANNDSAEVMVQASLDFARQSGMRGYEYAVVMTGAGDVYAQLKQEAKAEQYLREAIAIQDSLKRPINVLGPISSLSALYLKQQKTDEAEALATRLLSVAQQYEAKLFIREGYRLLSEIARSRKQFELALDYTQQYNAWNDSVFNEKNTQSMANVHARAELEQRELEVRYQTAQKTKENELLRWVVVAAVVAVLLLMLLLLFIYRTNKMQALTNRELLEKNALIELQNQEKDTLMLEIHHRVKNNLQIVSSLLNLQANSLTDEKAVAALRESHNRVKSIALIHQKLYSQEELSAILLEEYITQLSAHLKSVFNAQQVTIQCSVHPPHLKLNMDTSIPLGVILNELITNSIKYAQVNKAGGIIRIEITDHLNGTCTLLYSDNGIGMPPDFDFKTSTTLGMRIVNELARQMRGSLTHSNGQGTSFMLSFPLKRA